MRKHKEKFKTVSSLFSHRPTLPSIFSWAFEHHVPVTRAFDHYCSVKMFFSVGSESENQKNDKKIGKNEHQPTLPTPESGSALRLFCSGLLGGLAGAVFISVFIVNP